MSNFICDGKIIRDELGRHRIFRGINVVIKTNNVSPHKFRTMYCSKKFFDTMKKNGFNIVRLGITWEIVEPVENEYSNEYITAYKDFVDMCNDNGIYVMLDMHQDLFSTHLGNMGDGAPLWIVKDYPLHQKPYYIWAEGYFYMDNVQKAFYDFWNNTNGIQDKFIDMWCYFKKQFDGCENVVALDYFNEPYIHENGRKVFLTILKRVVKKSLNKDVDMSSYFYKYDNKTAFKKLVIQLLKNIKNVNNLKLIENVMDNFYNFGDVISGLEEYTDDFNSKYYEPFIDKISKKVNNNSSIFNVIEHNYYSNLGIPFAINTPANCLYSPHAYDIFIDSPLYNKYSSNERVRYITTKIKQNQDKMNLPVLFGEWGGGSKGHEWIKHIDYVDNIMEDNLWSNIYWSYSDKQLSDTLNRPYPVAINGTILKFKTDTKTRSFILEWEQGDKYCENLVYIPNKGVVSIDGVKGKNSYNIIY